MEENYQIKYKASKKIKDMLGEKSKKSSKIISDPDGSYTGVASPKTEKTVQDVDDL